MGQDLGTYQVIIKLKNGDGFIYAWETHARYTHGTERISPLSATRVQPAWESERDLLGTIEFMFTEGNYSCDCNLRLFLDQAHQREPGDYPCGDELEIELATVLNPHGVVVHQFVKED